jgi:uncharacterized protein YdeI (YjbR/CyaY-like superfamily)
LAERPGSPAPVYFLSQADWRKWLAKNHARESELLVGLFKVGSGAKGITYKEALDEALCHGWIDGVRKGVDAKRWTIRFTPRKKDSYWSRVNTKRMLELLESGRVAPAGKAAFEKRDAARTARYSFERETLKLSPAFLRKLRANRTAHAFFEEQPPGYRKVAAFWVMSAKKEETRERRFATLLADSEKGRRLAVVSSPPRK